MLKRVLLSILIICIIQNQRAQMAALSQGQAEERALLDKPLSEITQEDLKEIQSRIAILEQAIKAINNAILGTQEIELIGSLQLKRDLYENRLAELELKLLNYDLMQTGGSLMDIDQ